MRAPQSLRRAASLLVVLLCAALAGHAQLFPQPTVIPTGNWPVAVYTADVNGDGFPDLIYIDHGAVPGAASTTHVLVNDGKGHFTLTATLATVGNSLAIGHLSGSNYTDIGWLTSAFYPGTTISTPTLHIAVGNAGGSYTTVLSLTGMAGSNGALPVYGYLKAAQLVGGGPVSILAQDLTNNLLQAYTYGTATAYAATINAPLPDGPGPMLVFVSGTYNNDAVVAISSQQAEVADLLSFLDGFGLPKSTTRFAGTSGVHSLLLQDVNFDDLPDLIVEGAAGRIDVFPNNGNGTFSTTSIGGTGTLDGTTGNGGHLIAVADLNGDGLPDALASTPAGVSALLGNGTAYLGLKGIYNAGPGMHTFATADFNGDGHVDIATDSPEGIAILYGNGDGSFQTSQAFAAGQPAMSGDVGVFTASGNTDAVVSISAKQAQLLLGHGDGTFSFQASGVSPSLPQPTTTQTGTTGLWSVVHAIDADHDGKLDVVLTADGSLANIPATNDGTTIQLGKGAGTFQPPVAPTPSFTTCSGAPGKYYGTSTAGNYTVPVNGSSVVGLALLVQSAGTFDYLQSMGSGMLPNTDLFVPHPCEAYRHDLLLLGSFHNSIFPDYIEQEDGHILLVGPGAANFLAADGDLSVDGSLTAAGQLTAPAISSTFGGTSATLGFPAFPGSAASADLDGDGNNDLLITYADLSADPTAPVASAPNYLYIWFGSGGGKFLTSTRHPVNPVRVQLSRNYYQVAVADLNGDGKPDLILSDGYLVSVQYGNGDGTFAAEQHFLAGQGINTISTADLRHKGVLDLVVANGGTVFSNVVMNKEVLTPNPDVSTGGVTVLLNGSTGKTTTSATLTGSATAQPEPSPFEAAFDLLATLTPPTSAAEPTGTVTFTAGTVSGSAPVASTGVATFAVPAAAIGSGTALLPGTYPFQAVYSGDGNYSAQTFTGSHTVSLGVTTVILTPTTPLTTQYGGPANGTFVVNPQDPTYPATGTYTVIDNGVAVPICTNLPLAVNGVPVNCPYGDPVLLDAGPHAFQVRYNGDAVNGPATSAAVLYTILPDPTATTLTSSANPASLGQTVTFKATVTGTLLTPVGTVQFLDGTVVLGAVTLTGGSASLSTSTLAPGTHNITAVYTGTVDFNPSISAVLPELIQTVAVPLASQTTLFSSLNPAPQGVAVTFTATVQAPGPFSQIPTGMVTFLDGAATIGTGALNVNGIATFTTSALAVGTHPITASYAGDSAHGISTTKPTPVTGVSAKAATSSSGTLPSVSAVLDEVITQPLTAQPTGFAITVTPDPVTLDAGHAAVLLVTVRAVSGFAQAVTLSCGGDTMTESTCLIASPTIPVGGGATTITLSSAAPHDCGDPSQPYFLNRGSNTDPLLPAGGVVALAALIGCGFLARRRKLLRVLLGLVTIAGLGALAGLSGCGHCTDLGTRPGNYAVTVTGTSSGGTVESVTVPVTVAIP